MTPLERSAITNGIWLCQTHAKLIDDDEIAFPVGLIREWKEVAEHMAALEMRGFTVRKAQPFGRIEEQAPKLIAEMRQDIAQHPLVREFVLLSSNRLTYNASYTQFEYYTEDHDYLQNIIMIMENLGAVYNAQHNEIPRYRMTEEFALFLAADQ